MSGRATRAQRRDRKGSCAPGRARARRALASLRWRNGREAPPGAEEARHSCGQRVRDHGLVGKRSGQCDRTIRRVPNTISMCSARRRQVGSSRPWASA